MFNFFKKFFFIFLTFFMMSHVHSYDPKYTGPESVKISKEVIKINEEKIPEEKNKQKSREIASEADEDDISPHARGKVDHWYIKTDN